MEHHDGAYIVGGIGTGNWLITVDPASLNPGATATSRVALVTLENPFVTGQDLLVDDPACRVVEPFCGDGTLDPGEACDDGDNENGDGCSALCSHEGGREGCTPGYWKQSHRFDSYPAEYAPSTLFVDAFGVNAFPGETLLDVLNQVGGGQRALGRHAVSALLNASASDVDYDRTTAEFITSFNAAYASGSYETVKNVFETFNEQGCPLNGRRNIVVSTSRGGLRRQSPSLVSAP